MHVRMREAWLQFNKHPGARGFLDLDSSFDRAWRYLPDGARSRFVYSALPETG